MENVKKEMQYRHVGRKEKPITFDASGESLTQGALFNEEIFKTFGTNDIGVPKGVYHFKTHAEANKHMEDCLVKKIVKKATRI